MKGIGIGNGFISPVHQCSKYSAYLKQMGLINEVTFQRFHTTELLLRYTLGDTSVASEIGEDAVNSLTPNDLKRSGHL